MKSPQMSKYYLFVVQQFILEETLITQGDSMWFSEESESLKKWLLSSS